MTLQRAPLPARGIAKIRKLYRQYRWRRWCRKWNTGESDQQILLRALRTPNKTEAVTRFRQLVFTPLISTTPISDFDDPSTGDTFDILGQTIPLSELGRFWHVDKATQKRWPLTWHWEVEKVGDDGSDVKIPWELSRCQFLTTWARQYIATNNEIYARHFRDAVSSWIDENPPGKGVNWTCAMDVAIRVSNWLAVIGIFRNSSVIDDAFLWKFLKSVYFHGRYIENNLEGPGWYAANHYLADIAGLFFIGFYLSPILAEARQWLNCATDALESESGRQILSDGCCFEDSSFYHRLTFELLFYPYWLSHVSSQNVFSDEYVRRLADMLSAAGALIRPDGSMPQIGDNDSGQFFRLSDDDVSCLNYLLDIGALVFGLNTLKLSHRPASMSVQYLLGPEAADRYADIPTSQRPVVQIFPDAGWATIHSPPWNIVLVSGPRPLLTAAAHAHEDRLSFELSYQGKPVIVDPGTYNYTAHPNLRRTLRSRNSHNVLSSVAGSSEENPLFSDLSPESALETCIQDSPSLQWKAIKKLDDQLWTRTVIAEDTRIILSDEINDPANIVGTLIFHHGITARVVDASSAVLNEGASNQLWIRFTGIFDPRIVKSWHSPRYGIIFPSLSLRYRIQSNLSSITISPD